MSLFSDINKNNQLEEGLITVEVKEKGKIIWSKTVSSKYLLQALEEVAKKLKEAKDG